MTSFDEEYDVTVVGAGPAGLMAALCYTTYGFKVLHIDDRAEPTPAGRADGIQPRTIEVLRNIESSLAKSMIAQGVRVYEVAFWDPTDTEPLVRTSRAPSCPDYIDVVDNYTLLLHQGRIERAFLKEIEARRVEQGIKSDVYGGVNRPYKFVTCETDASASHPVTVTFADEAGKEYKVKSKYLLGYDGARSLVRRAISGGTPGDGEHTGHIRMVGEASDIIWGVCDVELKTDFPDIMSKCLIHSKHAGSIMVIPREDGLVRLYVQLKEEATGHHIERSKATQEDIFETAKRIFSPYTIEFGRVDWFSVYQIGQRIASNYTLDERVFLGGDATHTHSPKAGQGMNISFLDAYSLAWKINLVEKGIAKREILSTYESERKSVAEELLRFDGAYSALFSGKNADEKHDVDPEKFIAMFKQNAFFTSGCGAVYFTNQFNILPENPLFKAYPGVFLEPKGVTPGQRLLPGRVTRSIDANQVRIQQEVKMNGAFRIHVFTGDYKKTQPLVAKFDEYLASPSSFVRTYKSASPASIKDSLGASTRFIDKIIPAGYKRNPFFTFLTIFGNKHTDMDVHVVPPYLRQFKEHIYSDDLFDRRSPSKEIAPLHAKYGVDLEKGAVIVVRPDGYVGAALDLSSPKLTEALEAYFAGFLTTSGQNTLLTQKL